MEGPAASDSKAIAQNAQPLLAKAGAAWPGALGVGEKTTKHRPLYIHRLIHIENWSVRSNGVEQCLAEDLHRSSLDVQHHGRSILLEGAASDPPNALPLWILKTFDLVGQNPYGHETPILVGESHQLCLVESNLVYFWLYPLTIYWAEHVPHHCHHLRIKKPQDYDAQTRYKHLSGQKA